MPAVGEAAGTALGLGDSLIFLLLARCQDAMFMLGSKACYSLSRILLCPWFFLSHPQAPVLPPDERSGLLVALPSDSEEEITQETGVKRSYPIALTEVIKDEVYTAEGRTAAGERIYFGIERIDEKKCKAWNFYFRQASHKVSYFIPRFRRGALHITDEEEVKDFYFKSLLEKSRKKFAAYDKEKIATLKEGLRGGSSAAIVYPSDRRGNVCFVAYISKSPVTGYFQHPAARTERGGIMPRDYYKAYQKLVMTVRAVDVTGTVVFNNRGIFRSLISMAEGGYGKLSLALHGFTAAFFKQIRGKTHMSVAPLPEMYRILDTNVDKGVILTGDSIPPILNRFVGGGGAMDIKCVIPCNALIGFFTACVIGGEQ